MPNPIPPALLVAGLLAAIAPSQTTAPIITPVVGAVPAAASTRIAADRALRPQIVAAHVVRVDTARLRAFANAPTAPTSAASLWLGERTAALRLDGVRRMWKHVICRGHATAAELGTGHVSFAFDDRGTCAAAIEFADAVWSIEAIGDDDLHVLYELDHDRMPPTMSCGVDHRHAVDAPVVVAGDPAAASAGRTILDVAVFYTPAARTGAGGAAGMESQIALRVDIASQGSAASGVDHDLRLVHAAETNYPETGSTTDLSRFRNRNDGFMDEVHTARSQWGADLMALIINQSSQFCGVAYLMTSPTSNFRGSAFSVTARGCLSGHTLTHEMGHNMGSHHDQGNAGSAIYPYSYGYRTPDNAHRTIMAYRPGSRVNLWSGPGVRFQTYTMGTANADNVRSLNNTRGFVRDFAPTRVYEWCEHDGGISGFFGEPFLVGEGTVNNQPAPRLEIRASAPGAPGALAIGTGGQNLPLLGGILVPFVFDTIPLTGTGVTPLPFDASAVATLPPGSEVFFQAWFLDGTAVQGVSASDALSVIRP